MTKKSQGPSEIIDAGIDYLTLSIPHTHPRLFDFRQFADLEFQRFQRAGFKEWTSKFEQFEMLTNGTFSYGRMKGWDILRCSGAEAKEVAEKLKQNGLTARATRLDVQVTTRDGCTDAAFAGRLARKIGGVDKRGQKTRPIAISTFSGTSRDTGLTVGSRHSNTYSRVYDAHEQHKARYPVGARRVEIEFKDCKARSAWEEFMERTDQHQLAHQFCAGQMQKWRVLEPWMKEVVPCIPKGETISTTDEKRLYWLEHQVCPVIRKLMQGPHAAKLRLIMLDALGLASREVDDKTRLEENECGD